MSDETTELQSILDEFEHECFMLRVEASETRARDDVVRKSYERIRDGFAGRIATTLGNEHAIHGTLTAEQVREAIEANSWAETSTIREFNDSSWQAIADELNAALGSGECEFVDCGVCKFYHADIQLCEYGIPPCSKFERKAVKR